MEGEENLSNLNNDVLKNCQQCVVSDKQLSPMHPLFFFLSHIVNFRQRSEKAEFQHLK